MKFATDDATRTPSTRTQGVPERLKRDAMLAVLVASAARKFAEFARPAVCAALWQNVSAAATPPAAPMVPLDVNTWRPLTGVTETGLVKSVPKQASDAAPHGIDQNESK